MAPPTVTTANLGLVLPTTGNPDYESGNAVGLLAAALAALDGARGNVQHITTAGAITLQSGTVILNTGAASAITLANPVAGLPGAGGNDGQELTIVSIDAFAYVVTTAANKINGNKLHATFGGAAGDAIKLVAYGGVWYTADTPNGVTLS